MNHDQPPLACMILFLRDGRQLAVCSGDGNDRNGEDLPVAAWGHLGDHATSIGYLMSGRHRRQTIDTL